MKWIIKYIIIIVLILGALFWLSLDRETHGEITYGVSFSRYHSDELGLNYKEVLTALINDLKIRHFRFSAHWPITEPKEGLYDFSELDFQMRETEKVDADVILAVGRRLPGWPECHIPPWANRLQPAQQQEKILALITQVVERYRKSPVLKYWQVENEPYLTGFAKQYCPGLDEDFLKKEIELVRRLDPAHPILLTDGGEFGTWVGAYKNSDIFGSTMYLYVYNKYVGDFRYPIIPAYFRVKKNILSFIYGSKPTMVIEMQSEPWLSSPIINNSVDVQFEKFDINKFNKMIEFSRSTGFDSFYLWGAEWWYWLKQNGHPEFWERAKTLYAG